MTERAALLEWGRDLTEPALREAVDSLPGSVRHVTGYHFGWWDEHGQTLNRAGGKAMRPTLVFLAADAVGADAAAVTPAAVAVELVHNFSLIHDDVMDGDETRRHRPTAWKVFGTAPALLAGNAMLSLAFDVLVAHGHERLSPALRLLHTTVVDLLQGQADDLAFERRDDVALGECLTMVRRKTAALLECCAALGAMLGGATPAQTQRLRAFAADVGLAFQVVDDMLGIWGDPARTGKPAHSDLRSGKKSLPVVVALGSGTAAGHKLAEVYGADPDADVAVLADLVEAAGGRDWCHATIDELVARAVASLAPAHHDGLISYAKLVTCRDH